MAATAGSGADLDVHLPDVDVDITGDGGVRKRILKAGHGDRVRSGSYVTVHYKCFLEGAEDAPFDSSYERGEPISWHQGDEFVVKGWDTGVGHMREGERAVITVRSDYGYGESGSPPTIPPNGTIKVEVEVLSATETTRDEAELDFARRIELAKRRKEEGNAAYKAGEARRAAKLWESAVELAEKDLGELDGRERAEAEGTLLSCHLNAAHALLKLGQHKPALRHCDGALALDPRSVKALYRRALAHCGLQDFERARCDLAAAARIDPANPEVRPPRRRRPAGPRRRQVRRELAAVKQRERVSHSKERSMCSRMLGVV